jgi:hypothetical protein
MQQTSPQYPGRTGYATGERTVTGVKQVNGKAVGSLVCGLLGLFLGVFVLPILLSVAAVLLGNSARREISTDPTQRGKGIAMTGIVLGWIVLALAALALLWFAIMFLLPYFGVTPEGGASGGPGTGGG